MWKRFSNQEETHTIESALESSNIFGELVDLSCDLKNILSAIEETDLDSTFNLPNEYGDEIVHEIIYDHNIWYCSIYGSEWDDGSEDHDPFNIQPREIATSMLELNYCGTTPKLSKSLCNSCCNNFRKVKYYLDRNELFLLANNWEIDYPDEIVVLNKIKRPQTKRQFLEKYPERIMLVENSKERRNTSLIYKFDDYFNDNLENYRWYFSRSLVPLLPLL